MKIYAVAWRAIAVVIAAAAAAFSIRAWGDVDFVPPGPFGKFILLASTLLVLATTAGFVHAWTRQIRAILRSGDDWSSHKSEPRAYMWTLGVAVALCPMLPAVMILNGSAAMPGASMQTYVGAALVCLTAWLVLHRQAHRQSQSLESETAPPGATWRLGALAIILAVASASSIAFAAPATAQQAVVVRVIDGDTVDVRIKERRVRVRLLNIDTPESTKPGQVECLGAEATDLTSSLLSPGETVDLSYDDDLYDRYGRLLAHVRTSDGVYVSDEIARQGLGDAIAIGGNDERFADVRAALEEAHENGRGLFDPTAECTLAALNRQAAAPLAEAEALSAGSSAAQAVSAAATTLALSKTLDELESHTLDSTWIGVRVYRTVGANVEAAFVSTARSTVLDMNESLTGLAEERKAAEDRAAKKRAADEKRRADAAAKAAAEAKEAAERAAREAVERAAADAAARERDRGSSSSGTGSGSGSNPYPGYTGPRCYAPGGKTWKPC